MLPRSGVITRLFVASTATVLLYAAPAEADGPTARTKTQPSSSPERFPPLPDLIARKVTVDRKKERKGVFTKFALWIRESVTEGLDPPPLVADLDTKAKKKTSLTTTAPPPTLKNSYPKGSRVVAKVTVGSGDPGLILPDDISIAETSKPQQAPIGSKDPAPLFLDPLLVPASATAESPPRNPSVGNEDGLILPSDVPQSLQLTKPVVAELAVTPAPVTSPSTRSPQAPNNLGEESASDGLVQGASGAQPVPTTSPSKGSAARRKGKLREETKAAMASSVVATSTMDPEAAQSVARPVPAALGQMAKVADMPTAEELEAAAKKLEDALRKAAGKPEATVASRNDLAQTSLPDGVKATSNVIPADKSPPISMNSPETAEALLEAQAELAELAKQSACGNPDELELARRDLDMMAGRSPGAASIPKAVTRASITDQRFAELQSAHAELANLARNAGPTKETTTAAAKQPTPKEILEAKAEMAAIMGGDLPKPDLPSDEPQMAARPTLPIASAPPVAPPDSAADPILPEKAPAAPEPAPPPMVDSPPPPKVAEPEGSATGLRFAKERLDDEDWQPNTGTSEVASSVRVQRAPRNVGSQTETPDPLPRVNTQAVVANLPNVSDWSPVMAAPSPAPPIPEPPAPPEPKARLLPAQPASEDPAVGKSKETPTNSTVTESPPANPPLATPGPTVSLGSPSGEPMDDVPAVAPLVLAPTVEQCVQRLNNASQPDQRIRSLNELGTIEKWYVGPGAIDAVMRIASSKVDQPSRVLAVRMLGGVPRSTHKAVSLLRGLARSDHDAAVRQAAQNVLLERTASVPLPRAR